MIKTNNSSSAGDAIFGECLELHYYGRPVKNWMVTMNILFIAINTISALIAIFANAVFLVTYFKTPSLRNPHNFFLMLLAITDVSVGLVTQPLFIAQKILEIYDIHCCELMAAFQATMYYLSGISFLTVALVSMERYLAVCQPIRHHKEVTPNRMTIVAFTVWVSWLPIPILRFIFPEFYKAFAMFTAGILLVLFAVDVCIYLKIYGRFLRSKLRNDTLKMRRVTREIYLKKEARLAKNSICLLMAISLAYLPFFIALGYKAAAGADTAYLFYVKPLADTFTLTNSAFNPLFYCFRNVTIREAIRKRVCGKGPRFISNSVLYWSTYV